MICSNCGTEVPRGMRVCPGCGYEVKIKAAPPVEQMISADAEDKNSTLSIGVLGKILGWFFVAIFFVAFASFIIYTVYFWFDSWRTSRIYDGTSLRAPTIEQLDMTFGQRGHSLTFFGKDGDELFIPELNRAYPFVGGMTQIDIADSAWFDLNPQTEENATVTLTPVIFTEGNGRINLPPMDLQIATPLSPLKLIDPPSDRIEVDTSMYMMRIQVIPGSKVLINGEDQSAHVSHEGLLEVNLNVTPTGDNPVSINVSTPYHQQTRRDIVLNRPPQTIPLERSMSLAKSTTKSTFTVSGTTLPGANIVVDTRYVEDSLTVKPTGAFSFRARLSAIGDNIITWHATLEGAQDQYASYTVYYVPPLEVYTGRAWLMDYANLRVMTDVWEGRIFRCLGRVAEVFTEDDIQYIAINVAADGDPEKICILENKSGKEPMEGSRYDAYADVSGVYLYGDSNCPKLICRYLLDR